MNDIAVDNKNKTVEELSALFDHVPSGPNLDTEKPADYGAGSVSDSLRPFADVCEDVQATMEPEPELNDDQEAPVESQDEPIVNPEVLTKPEDENALIAAAILEEPQEKGECAMGNPLEFSGHDLKAYQEISKKYPEFTLFDGSQAFKDFYRYKVRILKSLLTSFPLLNVKDMTKEVAKIRVNHQIGDDVPSPDLIRKKLDECFACRPRLNSLLAEAHNQLPVWKKCTEMLSAKLWKDHESKGAHKRMSLNLEHMPDIEIYVNGVQGFIDSSTLIDNLLKAANESLSRQLSCFTMRNESGHAYASANREIRDTTKDKTLDNLDTIETGSVIHKPRTVGSMSERDFGGGTELDSFLHDVG